MAAASASTPAAIRPARGLCSPSTALRTPADITEERDAAESAEPNEAADPTETAEATEPIEQNERAEPTDPTDMNEPFEAIERKESSDHSERRELSWASPFTWAVFHRQSFEA